MRWWKYMTPSNLYDSARVLYHMLPRYIFVKLSLFLIASTTPVVEAQTLQGYVVDALSGDSLVDVHVVNVTRGIGTVTNTSGYFGIAVRADDSLRVSLTGYQTQTTTVDSKLLLIKLMPDTILLREIRVLANRVNMYWDTTAQPLRLPGVPHVEKPVRIKPMTWKWGQTSSPGDAPQMLTQQVGGALLGPISYFMPYERDLRKYERIRQEDYAQQGYRQAISNEETRKQLMNSFQLTMHQYDSLLTVFNQEHLALIKGASQEETAGMLFRFFNDATNRK